ncbi:hypothetical protein DEU34_0583 [Microbacterium sp. AG1240]|uniref:hypothetical protein n=1 Tax=Microbacterium sp. AG1240 TaxID=2183992 RepID=UPI000EB2F807|nr:hypothetical protein [Microbacterium sp. AG1240]RKT36077.1 hypothetical protein DEU34_0583 [Microbacterium sp. AG1240]
MPANTDVVLLCIHGIGRQRQGETAADVARAVALGAESIKARFESLDDGDDDHTGPRLRFTLDDGQTVTLRFHDGWWDEQVVAPAMRVPLWWALRVTPFVLWNTAALWAFDLDELQSRRFGAGHAARVLLPFLAMVACFFLAPLAIVVALVALVLSWPVPAVRRGIRRVLVDWLGDAWSYRSNLLDESVVQRLTDAATDAASDGATVMLVGHSQGGEIGRRVALDAPVASSVWVGSGESQLSALRVLQRSRWLPPVLVLAAVLFPPLFALVASRGWDLVRGAVGLPFVLLCATGADDLDGAWAFVGTALGSAALDLLVVGVIVALAALIARAARPPADLLQQPAGQVMVVKSLLDPVCLGPNAGEALVRYVPLSRPREWLLEHVRYFDKKETGLAVLEAVFGSAALPSEPYAPRVAPWVYAVAAVAAIVSVAGQWWLGSAMLAVVF